MPDSRPGPRQHIETTIAQHENGARITAARIGRLAAKITAGDFTVAHARDIALALVPLTEDLVKIGDAEQCAARHDACTGTAAREVAA